MILLVVALSFDNRNWTDSFISNKFLVWSHVKYLLHLFCKPITDEYLNEDT